MLQVLGPNAGLLNLHIPTRPVGQRLITFSEADHVCFSGIGLFLDRLVLGRFISAGHALLAGGMLKD